MSLPVNRKPLAAVFLELEADAANLRDVALRIAALIETGG